jgi:hypothetical protein
LLVPVISFRLVPPESAKSISDVQLTGVPATLTNRTFGIRVLIASDLFNKDPVQVRIVLISDGEQVGHTGMVVGAELDHTTGCVKITRGTEASIGLMLTRDNCSTVRIVVQDPVTDAVLYQTVELPVKLVM